MEDVGVTKVLEFDKTFFKKFLRKNLSLKHPVNVERLLIDGCVITSEGRKCGLLTYGYNPTGVKKWQITIFLAVTEDENIPVHLCIEKGNVKAYKTFREILSDLKSVKRAFTTIVEEAQVMKESKGEGSELLNVKNQLYLLFGVYIKNRA